MQKNDLAPDFDLTLANGDATSFYSLSAGKPAILFFYPSSASYSKTCQKQAMAFNNALTELGDNAQVIGVAIGNLSELKTFKDKFASDFPLGLIDKETQRLYGARKTGISSFLPNILASKRVTFIVNSDHSIARRIDLPSKANGPEMTAHVKEAVSIIKDMSAVKSIKSNITDKNWIDEVSKSTASNFKQGHGL